MSKKRIRLAAGPPPEVARWWDLLPWQRDAVLAALLREEVRLTRLSRNQRTKADGAPEPYAKHRRSRAFEHSAKAGAVQIARLLLRNIGGHP